MTATSVGPDIDGHVFIEHLGTGGYSDVYLYERRSPRMKVAVKVLKDVQLRGNELAQFAAEAETMAELADHPYIVQVFSTDTTADGRPYLVMKYYPPPNLGVRASRERFSVADVLRIGVKISSAVESAHRAGILHRDIKPANILVSQYGEPGLTDFGIAGHAADTGDDDDVGVSIPWAAPEVLSGTSNGSAQSDVYSLAATIWHLLAGRSPFEIAGGENAPRALMSRVLRVPPPATGRADVPPSLDRLLQQGLAKNPAVRPQSALDFARALQGVEQEQRFARTDLVVEGLGQASGPTGSTGDRPTVPTGPATQMRAVRPTGPAMSAPAGGSELARSSFAPPTAPSKASQTALPAAPPSTPSIPMQVASDPPTPVTQRRSFAEPPAAASAPPAPATVARPAVPRPSVPQARAREMISPAEPTSTVRRPTAPGTAPSSVDPSEPEGSSGRRRGLNPRYVGAIAAGVVVLAIVVGLVLSSGGKDTSHTDSGPPTTLATDQTVLPTSLPAPVVTATYDKKAKVVHFTWTVDPTEAGDTFLWYPATNPAKKTRTAIRGVDLPSTDPASTCIQVLVIPAAGGVGSDPSASVCGR